VQKKLHRRKEKANNRLGEQSEAIGKTETQLRQLHKPVGAATNARQGTFFSRSSKKVLLHRMPA